MKTNPPDNFTFEPSIDGPKYFRQKIWDLQVLPLIGDDPEWGGATPTQFKAWRKAAEQYAAEWGMGNEDYVAESDDDELRSFISINLSDRLEAAYSERRNMKHNPARSNVAIIHNPDSLIAPNPTPFGEVIFDDEDEIVLDEPELKQNPPVKSRVKKEKGEDKGQALLAEINNAALRLSSEMLAANPASALEPLRKAVAQFILKANTATWRMTAEKFLWWLDQGSPFSTSEKFKTSNKITKPDTNEKGEKIKRTVFSVFGRGNSKLPYVTFSTLPGITCPGAGVCLTDPKKHPNDRNTNREKKGGWCYSFKAWRYPAAYFRQLGNTLLIKMPSGRDELARLFGLWAMQEAVIKGGETIRLYVDGDIESKTTLDFWMKLCARHPHVRAYGYSKSWHIFLAYDATLKKTGGSWPDNYTLNLSEGSMFWNDEDTHSRIMQLPVTRHDFGVVNIDKTDGKKIAQNIIDLRSSDRAVADSIISLKKQIRATADGNALESLNKELIALQSRQGGVYAAIRRLEDRVNATVDEDERDTLNTELIDWKETVALLESSRGPIGDAEDTGEGKPKAYLEVEVIGENGEKKIVRKAISVPDEFWSRNPEYTAAVKRAAAKAKNPDGSLKYPPIIRTDSKGEARSFENFFVCPGKCGNCLGFGKHACGDLRLKRAIVIGLH